ncbi:MAG: bifunctional folylpolyglutamate synthase/dihydrofolate synthase [Alphaproteobacteria bacterium]
MKGNVAVTAYDQTLDRLYGHFPTLRRFPNMIDLSLHRVESALDLLDKPHLKLPPTLHIAGTNGKGSTLAFARSILEAAGLRVHAYTSPHLVSFHERINLAGSYISDAYFMALVERVEKTTRDVQLTFFEFITVLALLAFAENPADVVLLETGMGGRLDATNIIPQPNVTAITRISYDHREYLGDDLLAIAREKAGIIKPNRPCILAWQAEDRVMELLQQQAAELQAPVLAFGGEWGYEINEDGTFLYKNREQSISLPAPALVGAHQYMNAATSITSVLEIAAQQGFSCTATHIAEGLRRVYWPGRLQHVSSGTIAASLPAMGELWLDGAHNDSGAEILAAQLQQWQDKRLILVLGMMERKNITEFIRPLWPWLETIITIPIEGVDCHSPEALAAALLAEQQANPCSQPLHITTAASLEAGMALASTIINNAPPPMAAATRVLATGSLYLVGQILAQSV